MMRPFPRSLVVLALPLVFACAGGAAPATDTSADEAAIRAIDTNWNSWMAAQNDSAIAGIYAADAVLMPTNMPRVTGNAAIRSFWAVLWSIKATLVVTPVTIRVAGNWAIEEGDWTMSVPAPTGEQKDNGKYLITWRKDAGTWHAVQDIWNSDNPVPTPPSGKP